MPWTRCASGAVTAHAAGNRGADLEPDLAHYAFDLAKIGFAKALVCMGSFAAFGGWAVLTTGGFQIGSQHATGCSLGCSVLSLYARHCIHAADRAEEADRPTQRAEQDVV